MLTQVKLDFCTLSVGRGAITIMEVGFNPSTLEKGENITVFYEKQWFDATVVNRVQTGIRAV